MLCRRFHGHTHRDRGDDWIQEFIAQKRGKYGHRPAAGENFHRFLGEPAYRGSREQGRVLFYRGTGEKRNLKPGYQRILDGPQHAYGILDENRLERYYRNNFLRFDIAETLYVIEKLSVQRIVIQRVKAEIPSAGVFVDGAIGVADGTVGDGPERGYFIDMRSDVDMNQAKPPPDYPAAVKQPLNSLRFGIGNDVVILGSPPKDQVAHGSADYICLMAVLVQALHYAKRILVDGSRVDAVFGG